MIRLISRVRSMYKVTLMDPSITDGGLHIQKQKFCSFYM